MHKLKRKNDALTGGQIGAMLAFIGVMVALVANEILRGDRRFIGLSFEKQI